MGVRQKGVPACSTLAHVVAELASLALASDIGQPFRLRRTLNRLVTAAAECGAHTDDILAEIGYGADEIAGLRARQVI